MASPTKCDDDSSGFIIKTLRTLFTEEKAKKVPHVFLPVKDKLPFYYVLTSVTFLWNLLLKLKADDKETVN